MENIRQPSGSRVCGQCCVAMATSSTIEQAQEACGKKYSTPTKSLVKGLRALGAKCVSGKLVPIYGELYKLPRFAVLKVVINNRQSGWHWVLKYKDQIFDPASGTRTIEVFKNLPGYRITSYLEIYKMRELTQANKYNSAYFSKTKAKHSHYITVNGKIRAGFNSYAEADFYRGGQVRISHKAMKIVTLEILQERIIKNLENQ